MRLSDKRVLITGAGQGLGRALARQFARAGAEVIVTDVDPKRAATVAEELSADGRPSVSYAFDVTSAEQVRDARERIHADRGPIDVLVNNAGVVFGGRFLEVPIERHRLTLDVNMGGILTVTHVFLPDLLARPEGYLVNIVSASAVIALPYATSYAASKAAALNFSDSLREEFRLAERGNHRVLAVCPSYISTGLFDGAQAPLLTWILEPDFVAQQTVRAVERNRDLLILPWTARLLYSTCGWMPLGLYRRLCAWLGVSTSMSHWRGHAPGKESPVAAVAAAPLHSLTRSNT
jgi:all-trans-retinol dehydrogenase (NAD+)